MSTAMPTAKDRVRELLNRLPDDCTSAEILRELAFAQMVERGMADADAGRLVDDREVLQMVQAWEASAGLPKQSVG